MATTNTLDDSSSQGIKESPEAGTADFFFKVRVIFGRYGEVIGKYPTILNRIWSFLQNVFVSSM